MPKYLYEMEQFNFDEIIDRRNTYSVKYRALKELFGREDITPLWVADMEFRSPECIRAKLEEYVQSGVYGYDAEPPQMKPAIQRWLLEEHGWQTQCSWISFIPEMFSERKVLSAEILVRTTR